MPDTDDLILQEIRSLREDVSNYRNDMTGRLSTLEAHDKDLYGNGRDGRVTLAEKDIADFKNSKAEMTGQIKGAFAVCSAISAIIATGGTLLFEYLKH